MPLHDTFLKIMFRFYVITSYLAHACLKLDEFSSGAMLETIFTLNLRVDLPQ